MLRPWSASFKLKKKKKANSVRAFLQRNLSNCPRPVKEQSYNTYVRPILEYASTVWDPHTKELTSQLEMVQRRAARFVTADYRRRHSVTLMLRPLTSFSGKPSFSAVPSVKSPCYIVSIINLYPSQPLHLISYTPALQTVATICSCNNTTAASTHTSTPSSLVSSTCGTNCHQTQWGLHRSICSRTDSPPSRCVKPLYWTMFYQHFTMHCFY